MALRTRKPTKPIAETLEEEEDKKPAPKASRRKTVAGAAVLADKVCLNYFSICHVLFQSVKERLIAIYRLHLGATRHCRMEATRNLQFNQIDVLALYLTLSPLCRRALHRERQVIAEYVKILRPKGRFQRYMLTVQLQAPSSGPTAISRRPGTAQSVRPDSAMSSRGHSIPPVVVKKTRAPPQHRNEAPKQSRVRKKSPLNDSSAQAPLGDGTTDSRSSDVVLPSIEPSTSQASDMDSLTSGMKKIKLNLTTKAQREAKDQGKLATKATKSATTKTTKPRPILPPPRQNAPMPPSAETLASNGNTSLLDKIPSQYTPAPPPTEPSMTNSTSAQPPTETLPPMPSAPQQNLQHVFPAPFRQPINVPLPASSPPPSSPHTPAQRTPAPGPEVFVPYQPEGPPPNAISQQKPVRWLPPNVVVTPSPMKRSDLPVFTSTSAIPFAGANPKFKKDEVKKEKERDDSIWEVPETPRK
jgi:hypothetical protein